MLKTKCVLLLQSFAFVCLLGFSGSAMADVRVITGATPIIGAEGAAPKDITLMNEKLAVTFAVESDAPWGLPQGGILDIAVVEGGRAGKDRMTLVDIIPNNWSDWPATRVQFTTLSSGPDRGAVQVDRMWGDVALQTVYTLEKGSNRLQMKCTMTNKGKTALTDLLSGFVMWPEGGTLFQPSRSGVVSESRDNAKDLGPKSNKFTVAYEQDWAISLHAPFANVVNYEGKDLYLRHTLAPGASQVFEGTLQVDASGDSSFALLASDAKPSGSISGSVKASGAPVKEIVIVAEQDDEIVAWGQGRDGAYSLALPPGEYTLYATGKGYLPSTKTSVSVKSKDRLSKDFTDLKAPGSLNFTITDENKKPVGARITIEKGIQPPVRFLGLRTFFTELDKPGTLNLDLAPGDYEFRINSGAPFVSKAATVQVKVESGKAQALPVSVPTVFSPGKKGWVSIDLHHHSDLLDGVTSPEYLVRSQAAARLDYLFLSDHDTIDNLKNVDAIAQKYGLRFVPGLEISPSWAHFNVFPVRLDKGLDVNPATATATEIFRAARDMGAEIIVANHPMISYGYLKSLDTNKIPGGFDPNFDNFEINSDARYLEAIPRVWEYWNQGKFYPFTAGTDIHDVWKYVSGRNRLFVFMDKADLADQATLVKQVKAGHAYASMGPLVYPEIMFGTTVEQAAGKTLVLKYDVAATEGLKSVALISDGKTVATKTLNNETEANVSFDVKPVKDTWYAITVTDGADQMAWTNPVIVKIQ